MSIAKKIKNWLPVVLLALPMIAIGGAKLAGVPELHQSFEMMGLPSWFGYFIGAAELTAGIGLFVPRWSALAASGLFPILLGAIYFHLTYGVPSAAPAAVFVVLAVLVVFMRRKQAIWFPGVASHG
ncbi:DoxX family protein [Marinomonas mediterranea]|jgi:DoxX.|uniref:DoxX family protein n=1 Tax=Marinomonas mediterranea (strain ATCC 700492 / JCM 21426 / NBRC 103028 / MMB-1) TaxID=717774 RepID=F2K4N6_MARM1|nr:DoxX family protein [Marinomonas mediterranea]ADZ91429.1 DoxX family protein [Marinomonas mediterranea MMB-1]WCN09396.1 DoxX family membrane protein [Marinomonas mediterranea]WCN13473.1 DoxX family membrane protein [Marinomonas mediterranea]WCN17539.1 DoxX family membrane protein [Marinomonas mediterranea MMB-1]